MHIDTYQRWCQAYRFLFWSFERFWCHSHQLRDFFEIAVLFLWQNNFSPNYSSTSCENGRLVTVVQPQWSQRTGELQHLQQPASMLQKFKFFPFSISLYAFIRVFQQNFAEWISIYEIFLTKLQNCFLQISWRLQILHDRVM